MRRASLLVVIAVLLVGESAQFFRQCLAGFGRLRGERAFYRNDLVGAWRNYQSALDDGGPRSVLERDLIEVLLFELDRREVGGRPSMPLDSGAAVSELRRLVVRSIRRAPHKAIHWSVASDVFLRQSREIRRRSTIDLSAVSEEPLKNLTPEDWWGMAALEKAAVLEPSNYLYMDLIAEQFLTFGAVEEAARACRTAVAAYPRLDGHIYLLRPGLAPPVLDAAVTGFEEALARASLIVKASIEIDAGRLLARHDRDDRAIPFLERAVLSAPDLYDARMELAMAFFRGKRFREAIPHILKAAERLPDYPFPYYYLGLARLEIGESDAAIGDLKTARILGKSEPMFFHGLGTALESAGRLKEAERQFTAAAYQNPSDESAWSALLAFHLRHGARTAAGRICDRLLEVDDESDRSRALCATLQGGGA